MTAIGEMTHLELLVAHCHGPAWARCSEPERPGDEHTVYVWDCRWCVLGLFADVLYDPMAANTVKDGNTGEQKEDGVPQIEALLRALAWRARTGLSMDEPEWEEEWHR